MSLLNQMLSIHWKNRKILLRGAGPWMLVLLLLAWLFPGPVSGQDPYLMGIARLKEGSYEQARRHFEQVLAEDGQNAGGLLKMAEVFYQTADYPNAIACLERLEASKKGMGLYGLARAHAQLGNQTLAVDYLEKHLNSEFKLPSSEILLEEAFLSLETSREWRSLWKNEWYTPEERMFQEISYLTRSGDHLDALDMINRALEGEADRAALLAARGDVFYAMGNYQNAIQAYAQAISLTRMNARPFHGRARAFMALGKFSDAVPDLKRTVQLQPERLEILLELSEASRAAGDFVQALKAIEEYAQYFPDSAETHFSQGQVLFESGSYLKALASFNRCLELEAHDPRFYTARGLTYLATSTFRYAINDFGMALDLDPKNHEVWFQKGMARWHANDREGAIADWERAARYGSGTAAKKLEEIRGRE
jgi:tetratricopeptide (TPR) repeat protein